MRRNFFQSLAACNSSVLLLPSLYLKPAFLRTNSRCRPKDLETGNRVGAIPASAEASASSSDAFRARLAIRACSSSVRNSGSFLQPYVGEQNVDQFVGTHEC